MDVKIVVATVTEFCRVWANAQLTASATHPIYPVATNFFNPCMLQKHQTTKRPLAKEMNWFKSYQRTHRDTHDTHALVIELQSRIINLRHSHVIASSHSGQTCLAWSWVKTQHQPWDQTLDDHHANPDTLAFAARTPTQKQLLHV